MELHRDPRSPLVDGLVPSKVPAALPDSVPKDRSQDQPDTGEDTDEDLDEVLLLDQDSHRAHVTHTRVEELDVHSRRSPMDPQEHSLVNGISKSPCRSASQQRHSKAMFTRPVSANGEIQTGFTFGKAPSPKSLNLTRGRRPATNATTATKSPETLSECEMSSPHTPSY